ncbi:hypothetical protein FDF13_05835 [Brevibacterium sp. CS2]|nr:hypothetical protein FDF13_05835 [Brevibacterium sp. CS2]
MPDLEHLAPQPDPAARAEAAHATAALLVGTRDGERDAAATARFVQLADEVGLEAVAEIWSTAPAVSLPGALWRLYALRDWIRRSPQQAAAWFAAGREGHTVAEVIAGVEAPPGPDAVARAADEILAGAFTGDFAIALARASAFVEVAARGRVLTGDTGTGAEQFENLARDLAGAARAHRIGRLG